MDSNWIFDNSQVSSPSGTHLSNNHPSSNNHTPIDHSTNNEHNHDFTPNQSHPFLNFDSPSNHSDFNSNLVHGNTNTSSNGNSNSLTNNTQINSKLSHNNNASHNDADHLHEWAQLPDFNDIDMNFFQNHQDDTHQDSQPSHSHSQQSHNQHQHSIPPTPQSFDVTTYTNSSNSSFIQNFQSPQLDSNPSNNQGQTSIRPDVVFTPLVSPAVTPLESMINSKHNGMGINTNNNGNNFFSPLTSPALEAKSPMKYKKNLNSNSNSANNSNSNSPDETDQSNNGNNTTTKKKYKRKTPGNTPIVGPTIPGRISKQSPIIKAKRSSSYATSIHHHHQQQQQHANSNSQSNTPLATTPNSTNDYEMTPLPDPSVDQTSTNNNNSNTSMAPPSSTINNTNNSQQQQLMKNSLTRRRSKQKSISNGSDISNGSNGSNQPVTPATLMNFKLESSNSPVILPSNGHHKPSISQTQQSPSLQQQQHQNGSISHQRRPSEDSDTKKASHKLAEQGRRNRMNQAIMELGDLIPENLQQTISIPSKATTVELATRYILELKEENKRLREGVLSDESVSPLETK